MTFETFVSSTKDLCDKIAAKMISTPGGYWTDGDAGFTTGSTPPGRCLKYFNVGTGETYYVGLVAGTIGNPNICTEAVLVFFSTGWDLVNHKPSGTVNLSMIPITGGDNKPVTLDNRTGQAWIWYSDDGFTLLWKADPSADNRDQATLFALERDTSKEYSDGYTNFFLMSEGVGNSRMPSYIDTDGNEQFWRKAPLSWTLPAGWAALKIKVSKYIHPFGTELPPTGTSCANYYNFAEGHDWDALMWFNPIRARKSPGNAKVYLGFGWNFNDTDLSFRNFIKKIKTFFAVKAGTGLADGDIINVVVGVETWQYIYKTIVSPDGGQLDAAIRYA